MPEIRNFKGYGNNPPEFTWENNAKLAVQFVLNYEEGGENTVLNDDEHSEIFLSEIIGAKPVIGDRHMNMESIYEYGSRTGFWRIYNEFTNRKLQLTIFGVGVLLDDLKKISRTLEIEEQVVFAGYCNNPWQWYSGADAFLLSSRWEGMPNAALEALACGTSIIATAESGGIYEVSLEASDGSVIVANNGSQFIAAMKKVSVSDLLKPSLLPEKYKLDNVIDKFAELIDKL